jgi:hypothetical protein
MTQSSEIIHLVGIRSYLSTWLKGL